MANKGDDTKKTKKCLESGIDKCPNLKFSQGWEDEIYNCSVCGAYYKLYYEDME